jgi:hypothetical protein
MISLLLALLFNFSYAETRVYVGKASREGKPVYQERHVVSYEGGKVVQSESEYKGVDGTLLGKLVNDYRQQLMTPDHVMEDFRQKNKHGTRLKGAEIEVFNKDEKKNEEVKVLKLNSFGNRLAVGGQGLHYYLVAHMDEVLQKGKLDLKFIIPGKLDAYDFNLKIKEVKNGKIFMEVEIGNWFLRMFAPKLKLVYDEKTRHLLSYEGLSNLKDEKGNMMNVTIEYDYNQD